MSLKKPLTAFWLALLLCALCLPACAAVHLGQPPADWADKELFKLTVEKSLHILCLFYHKKA